MNARKEEDMLLLRMPDAMKTGIFSKRKSFLGTFH